jgi:glutathione synthase/RimK-type ligase-like ATP-grasp enzyme
VERKDWADPDFDWATTSSVLFRSTWDYFDRLDEFRSWIRVVSSKTQFINSELLLNWNIDKHYIEYLSKNGIRTIPTRYIPRGSKLTLQAMHNMTGWQQCVVKPTIGGAARHTYQINADNVFTVSNKLLPIMEKEDFMLQPFQHSVLLDGEWSFVFFGKRYSHAVIKKAQKGDFRVQDDFGGTVQSYEANEEQISFAQRVVEACPELPAYARVDVLLDNDGELAVSEVELIEPELWFRHHPEASHLMAEQIVQRLS